MEISFLGKTSFKFKTKTLILVVDPVSAKERADVVVYTGVSGVVGQIAGAVNREKTFVIDKEGEYELGGVGIVVDRIEAGKEGRMVRITGDGVEIADTAALSGKPEEKLAEKLSEADVLLVSLPMAADLIDAAEPYIGVLMGYETLSEVDHWLGSHKFEVVKRDLDKLKIDADSLPESTEIVVLNV